MIIDTHCHYNLIENWHAAWEKAQSHGVAGALIAGVAEKENILGIKIADEVPQLKAAIGFHPENFVINQPLSDIALIEQLQQNQSRIKKLYDLIKPTVVAIGEIGLDYFRLPDNLVAAQQTRQLQQHAFIEQLLLAQANHLPVLIHVRDTTTPEQNTPDNAYWDTLRIIREYHQGQESFILHCVSGPITYVQSALELGASIGVAGNVTYKNADHLRSIVKMTPHDRILLETDAPFLPPMPHRGSPCEPWMVSLTGTYLQEQLDISAEQLVQNTRRLFPCFG